MLCFDESPVTPFRIMHSLVTEVMAMRFQKHRISRQSRLRRFRWSVLLIGLLFGMVNAAVRPRLKEMTAIQAAYISNHAVDLAAAEVLSRDSIAYEDFVTLHRLEDGSISAMTANIREMNRFKTDMAEEVQRQMQSFHEREVSVPLGTLTGIELFSGRGPRIRMRVELYGNVSAGFKSRFDSAGINQTRHQIICDVKVGVSAIIPGCSTYTEAENSFTVSETVLAGKVPDSFTNVDTSDELYDDINNFLDG